MICYWSYTPLGLKHWKVHWNLNKKNLYSDRWTWSTQSSSAYAYKWDRNVKNSVKISVKKENLYNIVDIIKRESETYYLLRPICEKRWTFHENASRKRILRSSSLETEPPKIALWFSGSQPGLIKWVWYGIAPEQ